MRLSGEGWGSRTAPPRRFINRQPPRLAPSCPSCPSCPSRPRIPNADPVGISLVLRTNITAQRAISLRLRRNITATPCVARVGVAGRIRRANAHPVSHLSASFNADRVAYHSRSARISLRNAQYHVAKGNISLQRSALPGWGRGTAPHPNHGNAVYGLKAKPCMESATCCGMESRQRRVWNQGLALYGIIPHG